MTEELAKPDTVAWLRNVDRKPWSLEIPYGTGRQVRPMFPDLVIVRKKRDGYVFDILEPHDPSLADNFEKAVGLARFAQTHGHLFDRVELIREGKSPAGGKRYSRLDVNKESVRKAVLLITANPQLDELFAQKAS